MMKLLNYFIALCLIGGLASCGPDKPAEKPTPLSHAVVDYSTKSPTVNQVTGSSAILMVSASGGSTTHSGDAHKATAGDTITHTVTLKAPTMVQLVVQADTDNTSAIELEVFINDAKKSDATLTINKDYIVSGVNQFRFGNLEIPRILLSTGANTIKMVPKQSFTLLSAKYLARDLYSKDGVLSTTIYTQFAKVDNLESEPIWTRAYGLSQGVQMIPGPTLRFKPGDLLEVDIINELNGDKYADLHTFDSIQNAQVGIDEELADVALHGEFNVPHNLNNTNLHVHGLHVDPSKDDVTIVIVPEGKSTKDYDAPHQGHPVDAVKNPDSLNAFSVADQSVKPGRWKYQYKIPPTHLPGTHWFHPHKHGATSAQVENGMAGTIVIEETMENSVIPYTTAQKTEYDTWYAEHDRVLAVQEITNYGLQFGKAKGGQESIVNAKSDLTLTVNGYPDYQINVDKGQIERWRVVNAGTNHRSFSHVWLGKKVSVEYLTNNNLLDKVGNPDSVYRSVPMWMVAVDGITLPDTLRVTAEKPSLLAPGNRTDFLVQFPDEGTYVFFKNYAMPGITILGTGSNQVVYQDTKTGDKNFAPAVSSGKQNPLIFPYYYFGFTKNWKSVKGPQNVVPLIQMQPTADNYFIEPDIKTVNDFQTGAKGWTLTGINDVIIADPILTVNVNKTAAGSFPVLPSQSHMNSISPVGTGAQPSYVSEIDPMIDVLQSRPLIFDVSGIRLNVENTTTKKKQKVNQFTLNGRFFELNDPLGNLNANDNIIRGYLLPSELEFDSDSVSDVDTIRVANEAIHFDHSGGVEWPDPSYVLEIKPNGFGPATTADTLKKYYFVNPGYYQGIAYDTSTKEYSYDMTGAPDWQQFSGLSQMAMVNTSKQSKFYSEASGDLPSLPRATTAEEWYLVNNSDVGHPFHIHINPFFVVEVGQLSYEYDPSTGQNDFFIRADRAASEPNPLPEKSTSTKPGSILKSSLGVQGIVGNWWDTITIPPHGYVKVRYWLNVPNQTGTTPQDITVADDYDKSGIWVYHCHILRHEDRGMMMPVVTQPLKGN